MTDELKSFKRDWARWSTAERTALVVVFAFAAAATVVSSLTSLPF